MTTASTTNAATTSSQISSTTVIAGGVLFNGVAFASRLPNGHTTRALRLRNRNTLISDQYNHRVIEVSPDLQIVRTFGKIASLGYDTNSVEDGGLNSPYDAKRIGDYTGITPPFAYASQRP